MVLFVEPAEHWVVHVLAGHAQCSGEDARERIGAADSLLLSANAQRRRFAIDGGGELLLIRLRPRPALA
jgi:hypothetical protein